MTEVLRRYLVDNNAYFHLTPQQRTCPRFRDIARVPREVVHEAGDVALHERLDTLIYPMNGQVLRHLKAVMASVAPGDRSLVDLYHYRGTADPLLVACGLEANARPDGLIPVRWTVVSGDDAVTAKCQEFGLPWCTASDFIKVLEAVTER